MKFPHVCIVFSMVCLLGPSAAMASSKPGAAAAEIGSLARETEPSGPGAEVKDSGPSTAEAPAAPLGQTLGAIAADRLKALAVDTEKRLDGFKDDPSLLRAGIFYADDYARALKAKGLEDRYATFKEIEAFFNGWAPPAFFEKVPRSGSPSGYQPHTFQLKPKARPSEAIARLRQGLALMDCGSTVSLACYEALLEVLGADKFDHLFAGDGPAPLCIGATSIHLAVLLQAVPADAPWRRGQIAGFGGPQAYMDKHLFGNASAFNLICDDARVKGRETFVGFGLKASGVDLEGLGQAFVAAYNQDPVNLAHYPDDLAAVIRKHYRPEDLERIQSHAGLTMTWSEYAGMGGPRLACRMEFNEARVEALVKAGPQEALLKLCIWSAQHRLALPATTVEAKETSEDKK